MSAFPATGKTYWSEHSNSSVDSDSSRFPKDDSWPASYLDHIRDHLAAGSLVLVSSHEEVRQALIDARIPFVLVYPHPGLRDEYIERMRRRGSSDALIEAVAANWYRWISSCNGQSEHDCKHIVLHRGEYLADGLIRLAMEEEKPSWRIGTTPDPDAPKSPGQALYERWCNADGDDAEAKWETLAAQVAANMRDPQPAISDRDEKLVLGA